MKTVKIQEALAGIQDPHAVAAIKGALKGLGCLTGAKLQVTVEVTEEEVITSIFSQGRCDIQKGIVAVIEAVKDLFGKEDK